MADCDKLLEHARRSPTNLRFSELCRLAECYGFVHDRTKGSHAIYKHPDVQQVQNFQDHNGKAKAYQVRQLVNAIDELLSE